jgi:membrane protein
MAKDSGPSQLVLLILAVVGLITIAYGPRQVTQTARRRGTHHNRGRLAPISGPGSEKAAVSGSLAGRYAQTPLEIPARGWWTVIKRTAIGFLDDRLMTEAAGVTFYTLLALFPAIATLISLYGLFADPVSVNADLQNLSGLIPAGGMDLIGDQVKSLTGNGSQALGLGVVIGVLTSLWSANQGIKSLFDALNVVYHEREKRSYIRLTFMSLGFTLGAILFLILAMTSIVVVPILLNFVGFGSSSAMLIAAARWPAMLIVFAGFLAVVYRYGPSREHAKWHWVTWGSVFAAVTWVLASVGFSYYVANFSSYNKTYGSLGAAIGFMTWIWISAIIVLLGGELNAELEQQTEQDTTTGAPLPMGMRGAYKADTKP